MKESLTLRTPAPYAQISQIFGANANPLYAGSGLKGHTAIDWEVPWDTPGINCADDAYCFSVMNRDNPDPSKYRAVFTLVETTTGIYEVSYGHCHNILAEVGKTYQSGDVIYTAGNTGSVYFAGQEVTTAMKLTGIRAGTHFHAPQVRPVIRVKSTDNKHNYLSDGHGLFKKDGDYFQVVDYNNGYNGCIDPAPFFVHDLPGKELPFETALANLKVGGLRGDRLKAAESVLRTHYGR